MGAVIEFCELGSLDFGFVLNPKNQEPERLIILEVYQCFSCVERCHGKAVVDWEKFGNAILLSKYQPTLIVEDGLFQFKIESPLKEFAGGKTLLFGHMVPELNSVFIQTPFAKLPRQFASVAA